MGDVNSYHANLTH